LRWVDHKWNVSSLTNFVNGLTLGQALRRASTT
jgi:hypothetical protein